MDAMKLPINFSLILMSKNEEKIAHKNLLTITNYIENLNTIDHYEILVCDTSTDSTKTIVKDLASTKNEIKLIDVEKIGIGEAIKEGIDNSSYEIVSIQGFDIPTGLDFIEKSLEKIFRGYDLVTSIRGASKLQDKRTPKRKFFSKSYNFLINLFFNLKVKDTQSSITFKLSKVKPFRNKLTDSGPFLQTEIFIYARKNGLKIVDLPTEFTSIQKNSTIKVGEFSLSLLKKIIKKRIQLSFSNES